MSESPDLPPAEQHHHFLVQAPVPPMDVDGLNVVTVGIVLFAIAAVLAGIFYPRLVENGDGWWLGVCIAGLLLGFLGLGYCWNRRQRRRAGTLRD